MDKILVIVSESDGGYARSFVIKDIGTKYPENSVLAGQTRIQFVDSFDTLEEAKEAYPSAELTHKLLMPVNTFDHLPDDTDY